jgi:hypothetical protein
MNLKIEDQKLYKDDVYYCDTIPPKIKAGTYDIVFQHSDAFNCIMPEIAGTEALICWCKELCKKETLCNYCTSIQVGRRFASGELQKQRETFNQLFYKMRHGGKKVLLEIN